MPGGRTSAGAPARRESSKPALRLCVVRTADGPPQRIRDKGQQHLPGDEAWLIGEHRPSGEKKYYLANLPAKAGLRMLAAIIKARWICEQAHQQLKEELGLDHFEGRSWQGLHRHALMTMIAYAFLQHRRLIRAKREKTHFRASTFEGWRASLIKRGARQGIGLIEPGLHLRWHSDVTASLGVLAPSIVVCSFRWSSSVKFRSALVVEKGPHCELSRRCQLPHANQ